jgi:hypothetical protein
VGEVSHLVGERNNIFILTGILKSGETLGNEHVKDFVRNKLGCDCAEEVFKHIENEKDARAGGVKLRNKLDIGGRLLVYIVEPDKGTFGDKVPVLLKAGKDERDARGFNRFRLVLVSDDKDLKKVALNAFKNYKGLDEKVHLHVISKSEAKDL